MAASVMGMRMVAEMMRSLRLSESNNGLDMWFPGACIFYAVPKRRSRLLNSSIASSKCSCEKSGHSISVKTNSV